MQTLLALLQTLAAGLGLAKKRQDLNNTPEMQAAAKARADEATRAAATKAVAADDLDAIRKGAAE